MLSGQWLSLCILQGLARAWAAWRAATQYWAAKRAAITAASGFHTRRLLTAWFKLCHRSAQLNQLMQQAGAKLMQAGLARVRPGLSESMCLRSVDDRSQHLA